LSWEFLLCPHNPNYNPPDAGPKHAGKEVFFAYPAIHQCTQAIHPFEALVERQAVLLDDPPVVVNGVLLLDIHWGNEDSWDLLCL
jgi:hypothetical protein